MKWVLTLIACLLLALFVSCGDSALKYYNLGVEAADRDDLDEAILNWQKAAEIDSSDPDTRYNLGMALLEREDYAGAEENFKAAAKIKKDDYRLQYGLGRSLEMQGKYSEAKKAYRFSISLKSNFHPPYAGLGAIALGVGERAGDRDIPFLGILQPGAQTLMIVGAELVINVVSGRIH